MEFSYNPDDICRRVIDESGTDTCLVSFSCGKDSIAAAEVCLRNFKKVIPFYMYLVPGLDFVERALEYYGRDLFGRHIVRMPNPKLYQWLYVGLYNTKDRRDAYRKLKLPAFTIADVERVVREDHDAPGAFVAVGNRMADSILRRTALKKHGPITRARLKFYPVAEYRQDDIEASIVRQGLSLPIDYELFGRSFDGLDYRFVDPIKKNLPGDFARIKEFFPLIETLWRRMEYYGEKQDA